MRFLESYGDSPSNNRRGGTGGSERSLYRRGHARVVLFLRQKTDTVAVQLESFVNQHVPL